MPKTTINDFGVAYPCLSTQVNKTVINDNVRKGIWT